MNRKSSYSFNIGRQSCASLQFARRFRKQSNYLLFQLNRHCRTDRSLHRLIPYKGEPYTTPILCFQLKTSIRIRHCTYIRIGNNHAHSCFRTSLFVHHRSRDGNLFCSICFNCFFLNKSHRFHIIAQLSVFLSTDKYHSIRPTLTV